jgi:transposase
MVEGGLRGEAERRARLVLGLTPEDFVPKDHPLRRIKPLVDSALARMSLLFDQVYASVGRPSIPPERLLKSSLSTAFYTVRSKRQFCEQLRYHLLFEWLLDLNVEDEPFRPTMFTKSCERLLEAWASHKNYRPRDEPRP